MIHRILAFDTSMAHCAATLLMDDRVINRLDPMTRGQAEHLIPMLKDMLTGAGLVWRDLDLIGVGIGPGNFTGIRISVSAARGLALGLGIKALGVSTLEAQVQGLRGAGPVVSLIDARQGRFYTQVFHADSEEPPKICGKDDSLFSSPEPDLRFVGYASEDVSAVAHDTVRPAMPLTEAIARIARSRLNPPSDRPAPLYLRPANAALPKDAAPMIFP